MLDAFTINFPSVHTILDALNGTFTFTGSQVSNVEVPLGGNTLTGTGLLSNVVIDNVKFDNITVGKPIEGMLITINKIKRV